MVDEARPGLKVLVVDDSAVVRQALSTILSSEPDISVRIASDPLIAEQKMTSFSPDVIVLDLEMPRMDGLTFLHKLMSERPLPVVVCSSYAEAGSEKALRALELGAVDILAKPRMGVRDFLHESAVALVESVRGAAMARVAAGRQGKGVRRAIGDELGQNDVARLRDRPPGPDAASYPTVVPRQTADAVLPRGVAPRLGVEVETIVAVGASTGGTEALRFLLDAMPLDSPPLLIVQHMPMGFTAAFANRLAKSARIAVREAASGDAVVRGQALIARGDRHLVLRRQGKRCHVEVIEGPLVSRHRPSVDVLFRSVVQAVGPRAVGLVMTGMGDDGAQGLMEMKQAGAATFAQDEATSVVFGMPREAILRGAADAVLPLAELPAAVVRAALAQNLGPEQSKRRRDA
ncbi:MAG: chemotaxis response regulator protein-glutamate methylesterase [Deltaproteobacteria bacterium]|nr:chemotaxis response regulator protein-glutamate methylesterase [Deltaproteobacteria bacterium]